MKKDTLFFIPHPSSFILFLTFPLPFVFNRERRASLASRSAAGRRRRLAVGE